MQQDNDVKKVFQFDSFLENLSKTPSDVFTEPEQRKWLKIDLITAEDKWQCLFEDGDLEKRGDVYYLKMPNNDSLVEYYIYEIKKGLLMFFSLSRREEYNSTLKPFVKYTPGITNMWFPFESFESTINFIKTRYLANIYAFTARRPWSSRHPAKIRGNVSRTIRYSGEDADYSLDELEKTMACYPQ